MKAHVSYVLHRLWWDRHGTPSARLCAQRKGYSSTTEPKAPVGETDDTPNGHRHEPQSWGETRTKGHGTVHISVPCRAPSPPPLAASGRAAEKARRAITLAVTQAGRYSYVVAVTLVGGGINGEHAREPIKQY